MTQKQIPQKVLDKLKPKNINFHIDKFEELVLNDIINTDESMRIKLNRNLTKFFSNWVKTKLKLKEQIKINLKGQTRSGKSLIGIRILQMINDYYNYKFDPEFQICANQKEYRINIQKADFGMAFQIDENAFTKTGVGSMTEAHQLKDIQNITAKKNIHTIFITPELFLPTGATLGLTTWGKDLNNYLSRVLIYQISSQGMSNLLGYAIFDINQDYINTGCLIYKQLGGCNNVNKVKATEVNKELLKYSYCIDDKYKTKEELEKLEEENQKSKEYRCPFYNICKSGMCAYEHKKDKWIEKELKGGLDERDRERYQVALNIFEELKEIKDDGNIILKAKNGKELKIKVKMKIPHLTNTKFTGVEIDEITQMVISLTDENFYNDTKKLLEQE